MRKKLGWMVGFLIVVLMYFCLSLAFTSPPQWRKLAARHLFKDKESQLLVMGFAVPASRYQGIRYSAVLAMLLGLSILAWISVISWNVAFAIPLICWFLSGKLAMKLLRKMQGRKIDLDRDGELIAFARLYGMRSNVQLSAFCQSVARYLPILRPNLLILAQRIVTDGTSKAFAWFGSCFPRHPFADKLFSQILSAESGSNWSAAHNQLLEKITVDLYRRRKKARAPFLTVLNSIPSVLVVIMILLILIQYMGAAMKQISF